MADGRLSVLWLGVPPDEQARREFRNRGLVLMESALGEAIPNPANVRGAVFALNHGNGREVATVIRREAQRLLDYGCDIHLVAPDDRALGVAQTLLGGFGLLYRLQARTAPEPHEIAERIARRPVGPPANPALEIIMAKNGRPLDRRDEPLFQRAFHFCDRIVLQELTGGRSNARVFAVHMTVSGSRAGKRPQPFFAKIDEHAKIAKEFANYREFADRYIPFGLRPNVQDMVGGAERSLFAGDFADRSELLWDIVRRSVAGSAISSLVEETLAGWRNQAYDAPLYKGSVALAMARAGVCAPERIKASYEEHAARERVVVTGKSLWERLTNLDDQCYRLAPVHGDLHGGNVVVRNGQSILIDLASVAERGPLTTDLAALETWLAFELPPEEDDRAYKNEVWAEEIDRLYDPSAFIHAPGPCLAHAPYNWMAVAVRQLRQMGLAAQSCPTEYQTAVAVQLLRRCQWDDGPVADRYRRAHGFVLAARLVEDLEARRTP
ncbi:phosphotransferase [Mesorhizobium sp. WSM3876]|uniref:phosphotransferase n=1 Tax=Mesorhizobium sp. WSM3876 TaxID=422277 RepID=UPI000BB05410|nr:phosphotransferase [Mesorhizobium sp. WSM3876]PBB84543.1 hypothetical protein CK216_23225 [Mesorhizobium sp. WSM3876]